MHVGNVPCYETRTARQAIVGRFAEETGIRRSHDFQSLEQDGWRLNQERRRSHGEHSETAAWLKRCLPVGDPANVGVRIRETTLRRPTSG